MKIETVGQGRPLLYLHDWGFNHEIWNHQVDHFRGQYRNCLVDYNLPAVAESLTHDSLLEHLCGRIAGAWREAALGDAPFAILAHGFGAFIAYELIEREWPPEALVLFGGLARFTNDEDYLSGLAPERVSAMRRALHQSPHETLAEYYRLTFSGKDETVPAEVLESMPMNAQPFLKLAFDTLISHDYRQMLAVVPVRALIVQGDSDPIVPVWQGQLLRRLLRNSELYLCKGGGHAPFYTRYPALNRRIATFLSNIPG